MSDSKKRPLSNRALAESLCECARKGNLDELKVLLAHPKIKRFIDIADEYDSTALMKASMYCSYSSSLECVKALIEAGADPNIQRDNGWTALMEASLNCKRTSSIECVKVLLEAGADPNIQSTNRWTALSVASNEDSEMCLSIECVKALLEAGADTTLKTKWGETALDCAYRNGIAECIEVLEKASTR